MKKLLWSFLCSIMAILLTGCHSDPIPSHTHHVTGGIFTRSTDPVTSIPSNSVALFNATGGITLDNQLFTFDGTSWNSQANIQWPANTTSPTILTALYPAQNGNNLITTSPYTDNGLEDVLVAQATFTSEKDIQLTFSHLFAKLVIHIQPPLKNIITSFSLTSPKVERINADGTFPTPSGTHTDMPQLETSGDYTFIIPPMQDCNLTLTFTLEGTESPISHSLTHDFAQGYKYECDVTDREKPGIRTAAELIEFSKRYNQGGDLSAFGELQKDGKMLFCLLEDIDFSGISTNGLQPIGYDTEKQFNDIFDGQGHKISNINIRHSASVTGIFGRIGQYGIVKNLHLVKCSTPDIASETSSTGVGFITGTLSGVISNCSVTSGSSTVDSGASTGGLAGAAYAGSNIINCYAKNTTLVSNGYVGGIVGSITEGNITNCYSASNTITRKTSYSGGFCGYAESCDITNCYVYQSDLTTSTNRGQFIGNGKDSSVSNCYTDKSAPSLIFQKAGECTTSSNKIYNSSFVVESLDTPIWKLLEQWVTSQSNSTYAQWTEDKTNNLPAIFQ